MLFTCSLMLDASSLTLVTTAAGQPYMYSLLQVCFYFIAETKSGSAMAEGPRDALVSRNSVTTKHPI